MLRGHRRATTQPRPGFQAFGEAVHDVPKFRLSLQAVAIFQSFKKPNTFRAQGFDQFQSGLASSVPQRERSIRMTHKSLRPIPGA